MLFRSAGSILGNTLLVLGAAMFLGGLGRTSQAFSATGASAKSLSLFLAVAGITMPAVFDMTVLGGLDRSNLALDELSLATAIVLLGVYIAGLIFSLRTHADIFSGGDEATADDHGHSMSMNGAVLLLLISTVLTAVAAELLVGAVEGAARALGMTDLFIGFIVVRSEEHTSELQSH